MSDTERSTTEFDDAAEAIRLEYREAIRPRRFRCFDIIDMGEGIYRLFVGRHVELDVHQEGATAYRPLDLSDFDGSEMSAADVVWSGEVVALDVVNGHVFVAGLPADFDPDDARGTFFIREFPFLMPLHAIFLDERMERVRSTGLRDWLRRSRGIEASEPLAAMVRDASPETPPPELSYLWGPPGTGKTHAIGERVAETMLGSSERLLVVSTTNKATDEVALSIGRALVRKGARERLEHVVRVGKGALLSRFERAGLSVLLEGSESLARRRLADLGEELRSAKLPEEKARVRAQMSACRLEIENGTVSAFTGSERRVIVTTAYNALQTMLAKEMVRAYGEGRRFVSTVILDEAGLISRAATAALALHAGERVVLAGDPRQLAPISRIARVLPPEQARWLASSGLSHLDWTTTSQRATLLDVQYRMHPEIRRVVSEYQYSGRLRDAEAVTTRQGRALDSAFAGPRAVWYVLDEDQQEMPRIRAERGPGNRSWIREATTDVMERLFASSPDLAAIDGLFVSPFVAQARKLDEWFKGRGFGSWRASTIHAQQGAEADIVVFDTVNAGSHVWPVDEWRRMINVGLSRAREFVLVIASRDEMDEPYLRDLRPLLEARILEGKSGRQRWKAVERDVGYALPTARRRDAWSLGEQFASRRTMIPVLDREQERLCRLALDGRPRLVRGVAGSGKTVILANWLARTVLDLHDDGNARLWVVYSNKSLRALIDTSTAEAWRRLAGDRPFPWDKVEFWHVRDLLLLLHDKLRIPAEFEFDYDAGARAILDHGDLGEALCRAIFVDESQDLGNDTLRLLAALVERSEPEDPNSKSLIFFYDNAQNVYGRSPPTWSEMGIDMRGRSTVLKESFRSTQPILEFSLNVLYRLATPSNDADHRELVRRHLIEAVERRDGVWWRVHYNQIAGPLPRISIHHDLDAEVEAIGARVRILVSKEGVRPADIRILYMGKIVAEKLEARLRADLDGLGVRVVARTSASFGRGENVLVITTPHSFKGYDAEVVIVAAADRFKSNAGINAAGLYVAFTRARSILEVHAQRTTYPDGEAIVSALEFGVRGLAEGEGSDPSRCDAADVRSIITILGAAHAEWVVRLERRHRLEVEPIRTPWGEVLAHPIFHFEAEGVLHACFAGDVASELRSKLETHGIRVIEAGADLG